MIGKIQSHIPARHIQTDHAHVTFNSIPSTHTNDRANRAEKKTSETTNSQVSASFSKRNTVAEFTHAFKNLHKKVIHTIRKLFTTMKDQKVRRMK
ncbi:MAG: hypothetical protein ABSH38_09535 [Verrucomicrobiota bacterium]|jgi:hypothetical protein